jgi:hypothetical protein
MKGITAQLLVWAVTTRKDNTCTFGKANFWIETLWLHLQKPSVPLPPRQPHPPVLVMQPADARVMLGRVAEFCVHATVCAWFQTNGKGVAAPTPPLVATAAVPSTLLARSTRRA